MMKHMTTAQLGERLDEVLDALDEPLALSHGNRVVAFVMPAVVPLANAGNLNSKGNSEVKMASEIISNPSSASSGLSSNEPQFPGLMRLAGKARHLPEDASINVDHYLYGLPKR